MSNTTQVTCYQVSHLSWPGGGTWVQELWYRLDESGKVVPNALLNEEEQAALQALVDYRGIEVCTPGRGNSLSEMSEQESELSSKLSLALLSPEKRQEYIALTLVEEAHEPIKLRAFDMGDLESSEDDTNHVLVRVMERGPNWTSRYTDYLLSLSPDIAIVEASSMLSLNQDFVESLHEHDDSRVYYDISATLARVWRGLDWFQA